MPTEIQLFDDGPCFITADPETAGFYELQLPDGFRWMKPSATCRHVIAGEADFTEPCLLIRVDIRRRPETAHLAVFIDGKLLGAQPISGYGTYYFSLPRELLRGRAVGESFEIRLCAPLRGGESAPCDPRELPPALYELRVIDLAAEEFPELSYLRDQLKPFGPGGGEVFEILNSHPFGPNDRILDVGAGGGWTTVLLAEFSYGTAWGVDLLNYSPLGQMSFKTGLAERLLRGRSVLKNFPRFAGLTGHRSVNHTMERCHFVSMNAEDLIFRDNYFDFVFSLNAFEHISRPDAALAELRRVLRPGGRALIRFSPLYYSDAGSHLPACLAFQQPWAQLVMNRDQIKEAITQAGGVANEVDRILDSLNGWTPCQFIKAFESSGFRTLSHAVQSGFVCPGSEGSPEFTALLRRFPLEDLTTLGMLWYLEKPVEGCSPS